MAAQETRTEVSRKVRRFYEEWSFPGYEDFETPADLSEKAKKGIYARLLDDQLPLGIRVLDAGCGTGQLATFLSLTHRTVLGVDFSWSSLRKGRDFSARYDLRNVQFAQMNLFELGLRDAAFDVVCCNGVLHHTADARGGFRLLCRVLKPGGYFVLGLYNTYGRLFLNVRKALFRLTGESLTRLDYWMRGDSLGAARKRIWFMDQYRNPHDTTYTVGDVLRWFEEEGLDFVNAVPKVNLSEELGPEEALFDRHDPGTRLDHALVQLGWVFTRGHEGGFFLMIGRKRG
jgi:SAM-dependent methyltransferase